MTFACVVVVWNRRTINRTMMTLLNRFRTGLSSTKPGRRKASRRIAAATPTNARTVLPVYVLREQFETVRCSVPTAPFLSDAAMSCTAEWAQLACGCRRNEMWRNALPRAVDANDNQRRSGWSRPPGRPMLLQTDTAKEGRTGTSPSTYYTTIWKDEGVTICCIRCSGDCINHCYITQSDQQGRKLGTHRVRIR